MRKETAEKQTLAGQVAELSVRAGIVDNLESALRAKERQLAEVAATSGARNEKINELRAEKARFAFELKEARTRLSQLDEARGHVDALRRMTVFTRTRSDYERAVVRLTMEQKNVLSQINLDRDFLVKGSAGTGKTLVLLKAVEKAKGIGTGAEAGQDLLELPELFQTASSGSLFESLVQRERLAPLGPSMANIKDSDFSFDSEGAVRFSTLHSAKGLDFPVVLLYLDKPHYFGSGYDDESVDRMAANLVYVALTRAMDHLNVFMLTAPECQAFRNLESVFRV